MYLDPNKGYRKEHLWLPLAKVKNLIAIRNSLTFPMDQQAPIHAYEMTEDHILVPREYIPFEEWGNLEFPVEVEESIWHPVDGDHAHQQVPRDLTGAESEAD